MKKYILVFMIGTIFLTTFLTMNLYNSISFPGYGGNITCNNCHNQPALVKNVDISFQLGDWVTTENIFAKYQTYSRNVIPTIQTNNRSSSVEFVNMVFLRNSSHIMVSAEIPDPTYTAQFTSSVTSDKFGIIFNIDVVNFTIGQFLTNYNSTETNLDQVLSGQMAFSSGGHADFWYVDVGKIGSNSTGMASDKFISTGILTDTRQDIHLGVWYGDLGHSSKGYRIYFVRPVNTQDNYDAQFDQNGKGIYYAIATWDAKSAEYHQSSFDQMVVVGDQMIFNQTATQTVTTVVYQNQGQTVTETKTSTVTNNTIKTLNTTASAFTILFVMIGLFLSIPLLARRKRGHG